MTHTSNRLIASKKAIKEMHYAIRLNIGEPFPRQWCQTTSIALSQRLTIMGLWLTGICLKWQTTMAPLCCPTIVPKHAIRSSWKGLSVWYTHEYSLRCATCPFTIWNNSSKRWHDNWSNTMLNLFR